MATFPHKLAAMMRRATMVLALGCALWISAPGLAGAASGTAEQAITDCNNNGKLTQQYSSQALRQALAQMPADVREYTDCFDVIERQLFKQLGNNKSGAAPAATTSSSSSFLPTWLIVVIVLLALAAITFGALAIRRRGATADGGGSGSGGPGGPGAGGSGSGGPGGPGAGGSGAGGSGGRPPGGGDPPAGPSGSS
jgi:hypothetical protein